MSTKHQIDLVHEVAEANACIDIEVAQDKCSSYLSVIQALYIWQLRILQLTKEKALNCSDPRVAEMYFRNATQVMAIWKDRVKKLSGGSVQKNDVKNIDVEAVQEITTGKDIREIRMALGFTVIEFADVLKVPPGTLGSWESRQRVSKPAKVILNEFVHKHEAELKMLGPLWKELKLKQLKLK